MDECWRFKIVCIFLQTQASAGRYIPYICHLVFTCRIFKCKQWKTPKNTWDMGIAEENMFFFLVKLGQDFLPARNVAFDKCQVQVLPLINLTFYIPPSLSHCWNQACFILWDHWELRDFNFISLKIKWHCEWFSVPYPSELFLIRNHIMICRKKNKQSRF